MFSKRWECGKSRAVSGSSAKPGRPPPLEYAYDRAKQALMLETERPIVFREALRACRNGGTVSVPGVYGGFADKIPLGAMMNKGLTIKTGQTHVQRYMQPLLERVKAGQIDPSFVITHRMRLEDAPKGYKLFLNKTDECIKIVLKPGMTDRPEPIGNEAAVRSLP